MLSADQSRFLALSRERGVRVLVIGGQALIAHGLPRSTVDLDVLVAGEPAGADALATVVCAILPMANFEPIRRAASTPGNRLYHCLPDGRHEIDILTSIDGISFAAAFSRAVELTVHGVVCQVAAIEDLIAMKRVSLASNQRDGMTDRVTRDTQDVAALERHYAAGAP